MSRERTAPREIWLFAYGSLMIEGALEAAEKRPALVRGYRRALCIYSHVYRGTRARPGLVLGLDRGGSCRGVAFRFEGAKAKAAMDRVAARENVTGVYLLREIPVTLLADGKNRARRVMALAFVADRDHSQYAGKLSSRTIARLLRQGKGTRGRAADYLKETLRCIAGFGIRDRGLERIGKLIEKETSR